LLAHAWEMAMAQQLLNSSCWVNSLHLDMAGKCNMSIFRASA
jgi:hypothetical protein